MVADREIELFAGLECTRQVDAQAIVLVSKCERLAAGCDCGNRHTLAPGRCGSNTGARAGGLRAGVRKPVGHLQTPHLNLEIAKIQLDSVYVWGEKLCFDCVLDDEFVRGVAERDFKGIVCDLDRRLTRIGIRYG